MQIQHEIAINVVLAFMMIAAFLAAMVLHECGHALTASLLGDTTPRSEGRQTLRLSSHIDPMGVLLCVILAFFPVASFPIGLGWGKPVKPDPWKMRVGTNAGVMIVACAGMFTSLLVGVATSLLLHFLIPVLHYNLNSQTNNFLVERLLQFLTVFAMVNIGLAIFNLLPLYPLDGYQILYTLLPSKQAVQFARSAQYGPFIILAIIFLLPFLAQISGINIPRLNSLIASGAGYLVSLLIGPEAGGWGLIQIFYTI